MIVISHSTSGLVIHLSNDEVEALTDVLNIPQAVANEFMKKQFSVSGYRIQSWKVAKNLAARLAVSLKEHQQYIQTLAKGETT